MISAGGSGANGEFVAPGSSGSSASGLFAVSAGLDLVSGVFGYLSAQNAQSVANSRADMIRMNAQANAQRYAEKATADIAQQKVMFLASGVTLAGSPIDVLDEHIRLASEDVQSIEMSGAAEALDEEQTGSNAMTTGRNALIGGVSAAAGAVAKSQMTPAVLAGIYAQGANGN